MAGVDKSSAPRRPVVHRWHQNQILSKWRDFENVGYSRSVFCEKLREIYSQEPDSVCMNEGLCVEQGHFCHTVQKSPTYSILQQSTVVTTGDSRIVANDTCEPLTLVVELESSHTRGISVTVTRQSDVSFDKKIPLELTSPEIGDIMSSQSPLTVENTSGYTSSVSEEVLVAEKAQVTLQPGQKAMAVLDISWREVKGEFLIPFAIDGWCMSSFPRQVNGQRVWLHDISSLFDQPPMFSLHGNFECISDIKGSVDVQLI